MILASTSGTLDELAELADRIMEVGTPSVSAFYPPTLPPSSPEIDLLRTEVAHLQQVVKSLQKLINGLDPCHVILRTDLLLLTPHRLVHYLISH